MNKNLEIKDIAQVAHELNRSYSFIVYGPDYDNIKPFPELDEQELERIMGAVEREIKTPTKDNRQSHDRWVVARISDGWEYGEKLDREKKIHPNLRPYDELPASEKLKDHIFKGVCAHFKEYL